jgi:putative drug exporter of the RND superfamily
VVRDTLARLFAWVTVSLRWLILPAWIVAALASVLYLPALGSGEPLALGGLVPTDAEALMVGQREAQLFRAPLSTDTVVVQRNPQGLPTEAQRRAVERALAFSRANQSGEGIAFALPISNALGLFPGSRERGTTVLTYLFFDPAAGLVDRVNNAHLYASQLDSPGDALVGVTGPAPARLQQYEEIDSHLDLVEIATVLVIFVVVGLTFKAIGAPLLTLFVAAIAFIVSDGVIPWVATRLEVSVPAEVEPLVVALTLGIVTDYCVFYLSADRQRLLEGVSRVKAARMVTIRVTPIIATAGLIVVVGTAALVVGELEFFRAFAPALAITAAVSLVVSVTLVPALLAIVGWLAFWPGVRAEDLGRAQPAAFSSRAREAVARFVTSVPVALVLVAVCGGILALAASGLSQTKLAFRLISGLSSGTEESRAADAAGRGFAPGVLAPTVVLVQGGASRTALVRLEEELGQQQGVAGVLGPREQVPGAPDDLFVTGQAARFALFFDESPLDADAIEDLRHLEDRLPTLLREAGLGGTRTGLTGQTAIASQTVEAVVGSSVRVGAVVLAVNFILLALFLRALVAPLYLLAASVASVAATLGLTTYVFQDLLGHSDLTYYVPFAAGVLLVSLGSDYNVYVVGRIWDELRNRPVREAIAVAVPRASKAISVAGIALALSFAVLAVVPLDAFREFAFMMSVGVLIETFLVRSLLIPSLISVFGRTSMWPGRVRQPAAPEEIVDPARAR